MAQDLQLRIRISADGRAAIDGINSVEQEVNQLGDTAKKIGGLIAGYLSFQFLSSATQELFKVQARLQDLAAQYTALTGSQAAAAQQMLYVQNTAQRLSQALDGARDAYGKMLVMVDAGLLSIKQAQQMYEGLSAYARLAGASADQVGLSMYGLSQALGQGRVQMTELLQITEPLPGSLNKIAAAAKMTTGELRAMVMDPSGAGVSSAQLRDWVIKAFGDAVPVAEQMAGNLSATWIRVQNDWRLFLEDMGSSSGFADMAKTVLDGFSSVLTGLSSPQFTSIARNLTALFSTALNEIVAVLHLVMDSIEILATVYLGGKLVQAFNIARAALATYYLVNVQVSAAMLAMTGSIAGVQAATVAFGAALRVAMGVVMPLVTAAATAYLLLADNTDYAAEAQNAYNRVLKETGGSLTELAEKYKTLSDAQKKAMMVQLSLELKNQQSAADQLKEQIQYVLADIKKTISEEYGLGPQPFITLRLNKLGFQEAMTGDAAALLAFIEKLGEVQKANEKWDTTVRSGLFGQKDLMDSLKQLAVDYQKTGDGIRFTQDALDLLNGKLPQTAQGFEQAGAAAQRAGKDFYDALNKDWAKLATFGMNQAELAALEVAAQKASAAQTQLAVSVGAMQDAQTGLTDAYKTGSAALITQAESALRAAAELAIAAQGADAFGRSMATLEQDVAKGTLTQIEAIRISNQAAEQAQQQARQQLDAEGQIQRARRDSAKAAQEAFRASSEAAQTAIDNALAMADAWKKGADAADDAAVRLRAAERAKKESLIVSTGQSYGTINLDALVQAIIQQESGGNPNAVSPVGALGLMQLMPSSFPQYSRQQLLDPKTNVQIGTDYIKQLLDQFKDLTLALAAYNAGPGNVQKYGNQVPPFKETQDYVKKVQGYYAEFSQDSAKSTQALNEQLILTQELQKRDAERLAKGQEQIATQQQQTDLLRLQNELIEGQYKDVKTTALTIPAEEMQRQMTWLQQQGLTAKDAAAALAGAIEATYGLRNAQQAQQAMQTSLQNAVAQYQTQLAGATEELKRQQTAEQERQALMQQHVAALAALAQGPVALKSAVSQIGQELDAGVATSAEAVNEYFALVDKINTRMREMAERGYGMDALKKESEQLVQAFNQEQLKKISEITAGLEQQRAELVKHPPSWAELTGQITANNTVKQTEIELSKIVTVGMTAEAEAQKKVALEKARALEAAQKLADAEKQVAEGYLKSLTPMEKYADAIKKISDIEKVLLANQDKYDPDTWSQMQRGLQQLKVDAEQLKLEIDPMAQAFKSAAEGIYDAWSGMWESIFTKGIQGFGDLADQIKTMFLKLLAQLTASALAKPILLPVVQMMGGVMGLGDAAMAPVVNNLFGAGTLSGLGGVSNGLGLASNLSSGGGIGSGIGGMIGGVGNLFGSLGLQASGAMMSNLGLLSGIAESFSAGMSLLSSGSIGTGLGLLAGGALPILGALGAIASLLGDFGPTPHPSSIATVGGFWQSENGPEYPGKGGGKAGASGLVYGYDWGHTDPADAAKIRDAFMEIDQALVDLVPNVNLAGQKLGEFGQTAEGFIANGEYVADMDAVTAGFVQAWVKAAAETGAVSELVNRAFQSMTGTAEELLTAFSALQQMDAAGTLNQQMIDIALALKTGGDRLTEVLTALGTIQGYGIADPIKDFEILLTESLKTTFAKLGDSAQALTDGLAEVDWTDASSIQELAGLVQARYALELQLLSEINTYLNDLTANFAASIDEIQLSVMDSAQQYDFYAQKAAAAFSALQTATDPAEIARLAEEARQAAMSAYGLLDDAQKQQVSSEFIGFLEQTQRLAQDQLNAAQQQIIDQHQQTADLLAAALQAAGEAAADALEQAANALKDAGNTAANAITSAAAVIRDAMRAGETVSVQRMASGGFVGGAWNGQAGPAGDTVATMLTPGEAVISREQAQKHAGLLRAIMADQVRYAAGGVLPGYGGGSSSGSGLIADLDAEIQAAFTARRQSDLEALRTVFGRPEDVFDSPEAEEFILGLRHFNAEMDMLNRVSETEKNREQKALRAQNADALADFLAGIQEQLDALTKTQFEQTLAGIQRQFEQNIAQAQALGANEEELATIRELANRTLDDAIEQRNKEMDALIRTANAPAIPDAVEQLQSLMEELAAAEEQARQLGATEQELALIRAGNESRLREFEEDRQAQLEEVLRAARESGLSEFTQSLRAMNREMDDAIAQARELGATESELAELRAYAAEQTRAAAQSAIDQKKAEAEQEIESITSALDALIARFAGVKDRIEEARVSLLRERADWDEVAYQNQRIGQLQQRLMGESAEDQINTLGEIQDAILARYDAEQKANADLIASAEQLQDTARRIRDYLNSLKLSSLTPLSPEQRLAESRTQWQTTLAAAQGGDSEALSALTDQANAYLSEAQSYFASNTEYAAIFAQVTAALEAVAGGIEAGPTPEELTAGNTSVIAQRQAETLAALEALRQQADQLQAGAQSATWAQTRAIQDELAKQTANILSELVAQQANDTNNLKLTSAEFQSLQRLLSTLSKSQLETLSTQLGAARNAIGATEDLLSRLLSDGATQQKALQHLLSTNITVNQDGTTQTVGAILKSIQSGSTDTATVTALLNQSLRDGQVQTGNLSLLLSKHIDVAGLNKDQIITKLAELISSGKISAAELNSSLRWITETGTLSAATLQPLIDGFRQGEAANQLMIGLLQQQVAQGGTSAALAQSTLEKLTAAQTAYASINSLLDQIRRGDLSFTADVAAQLQSNLAALNTNNALTTQMQNVLNGSIIEDKNQTVAHVANLRDQFTIGTPRTQLDWIGQNTIGTWKAVQDMQGVLWGLANGIGGYATGGYAEPGLAVVGEEGPELIRFTQPGVVYTAAQTRELLAGANARPIRVAPARSGEESEDTERVVLELKALIRLQAEANRQLIGKLEAVESRLAGIESKARLEAAA